jgi:hypothetical protein
LAASGPCRRDLRPLPARLCRNDRQGTLVREERSGVALRDVQGLVRQVIWPRGYSARDDGGRIVVLDATGAVVAHEGDRVAIGGGEIDAQGTWMGCGGTTVLDP